jgi:hypothetical protein
MLLDGIPDDEGKSPLQHLLTGDARRQFLCRVDATKGFESSTFQGEVVGVCELCLQLLLGEIDASFASGVGPSRAFRKFV